jgi:hypothetical protein
MNKLACKHIILLYFAHMICPVLGLDGVLGLLEFASDRTNCAEWISGKCLIPCTYCSMYLTYKYDTVVNKSSVRNMFG